MCQIVLRNPSSAHLTDVFSRLIHSVINLRRLSFGASLVLFFYFRFEEIVKRNKVEYHAGGSTQNSVKIAQVSALCLLCGAPECVLNIQWYACNPRFVSLAALGVRSVAAQHVDTLQF